MDEACEELDGLMTESVREQLVSEVPVGVWLSGGLDSSTLTHYAGNNSAHRLKTFSITFRVNHSTKAVISAKSRAFGADHTEFDLNERAIRDIITK